MTDIISAKKLSIHYADKTAVKDLSFSISPGQIIGFLGPNGAGKSSTIKALIGLNPNYYGELKVCGFDLASHAMEVKKRIGYVPENAILYDMLSGYEYLEFIARLYDVDESLIASRAEGMLRELGLAEVMHKPSASYSKGMRQKLLLASALVHDPEVLFLDEPLSGLDANAISMFKDVLSGLAKRGKTIFYSSHLMDVVERVCHRIIIIAEGEIIADGSMEDLAMIRKEQNLEAIFTHLTASHEFNSRAHDFLSCLYGDA